MAHELEVWLFDGRVGSLSLVHGRLSFAYATDWLALLQATALSQSLQAEPFDDHQSRPFFAGLQAAGCATAWLCGQCRGGTDRSTDRAALGLDAAAHGLSVHVISRLTRKAAILIKFPEREICAELSCLELKNS